ncbi:MAG: hypothetical protein ACTHMA_03950 [Thermomicrobiales bacterium]
MPDDKELYDLLSMLDRLEEIREDLLEIAGGEFVADEAEAEELREEMQSLGVSTLADIEHRIAEFNAQLDLREHDDPDLPDE